MKKCIFYTYAYNAEKTIARAIESVIAQTDQNWVWYLLDNASTDGTGEIIKQYASKDSRIIALRNKQNHVHEKGHSWTEIIENYDESDYFCFLDADDEYKTNFLTNMERFISNHNLDVAACGHDFIDETTKDLIAVRRLGQNLILDTPEMFNTYFTDYHQFMRTVWCKLYKVSVLRRFNFSRIPSLHYGADTLFTIENFRNASRVGILADSLHKYYMNPHSSSHQLDASRITCDRILDDTARAFLIEKCGAISLQNEQFLHVVYYNGIYDTIGVILKETLTQYAKLQSLYDVLTHKKTKELFQQIAFPDEELDLLRTPVINWLVGQKKYQAFNSAEMTVEILMAIYPHLSQFIKKETLKYLLLEIPDMIPYVLRKDYNSMIERFQSWYKTRNVDDPSLTEMEIIAYLAVKPDDQLLLLFLDIKKKRPLSSKKLNIDSQIANLLTKYPLLQNISDDLVAIFSNTVCWIMKGDLNRAFDEFISTSQNTEIPDAEAYILLGQNLSAAVKNL
ncbi:glycosyltransferase family 2 protein [Lysinibacillus sp. CNPSo 3705]|uniref:glycosyltransferase family 2 protein n=1 Tax=Lysinibacillus sp. CNPSo 3705 TaxID=3028148 RepID=UPI0023632735|nr:glycosyltransferase family 2 protein [Lysinibacillus sp. CNPSo 3705]MDD1505003.1 glycosyltransferase family 2 protein [Lysinibacillus sp. CNPSo 3705]